jgi:rare lipoprotein A
LISYNRCLAAAFCCDAANFKLAARRVEPIKSGITHATVDRRARILFAQHAVGDSSQRGTKTASGIPHDDKALTAAHKSLPFGSKVKVTNKKSGDTVTVTITDRGPYVKGRCIDLSKAGASALGFAGLVPVSVVPVVSD